MNNYCDNDWFRRSGAFNTENDDHIWTVSEGKVEFPKKKKWQHYVDSRRLEITCGEAPYLVSRYDVSIGELIVPPIQRVGILDRKLRIVNENTDTYEEWLKWTIRAFEASYGYEYQGDNVLIARINLLLTFTDYYEERWQRHPDTKLLKKIANKIAWNIWQMDGLKNTVPLGKPYEEYQQITFYDMACIEDTTTPEAVPCRIFDWRRDSSLKFMDVKEIQAMGKKLFDYVIGNPPYQEETESDSTRKAPVYNLFMDKVYELANVVELITPARFLFDAGQTPKAWNRKMLEDPHLKVLYYEPDASKIFPNTDIKGGVAISYRNALEEYGPIQVFVQFTELRTILKKAGAKSVEESLTYIAESSNVYNLKNIYTDHPDYTKYIGDGGRHSQLKTNVLNINPIFTDTPTEDDDYIVYGLVNGKRGKKYCHRRYLKEGHKSLYKYKVLVPKATGSGKFGEPFPEMIIVQPNVAFTQTYISIGVFDKKRDAENLFKYLKTKFSRTLLSVLKVTQDNLPAVWRYIPKQDFTPNSDIDWSKSIHEIDLQLYRKYKLDEKEIEFIETHVKEMV